MNNDSKLKRGKIGVGVCPTACWPNQSYDGFPVPKLVLGHKRASNDRAGTSLDKSVLGVLL